MKNPHAVALGAKGGKAKSKAKIAAVTKNLELARAKRWPCPSCGGLNGLHQKGCKR